MLGGVLLHGVLYGDVVVLGELVGDLVFLGSRKCGGCRWTSLSGDGLLVRDCINILDSFSGDVLLVRDCINSIINWCLDNKLVFMIGLLGLIDNLSFGGRRLIGEMVF